jgi:subtilisin family serine protease
MDISNNSWGGVGRSQALEDAIRRADNAGHIFIAAAGNGGSDGVGDNNDATPKYPASYGLPNVVSVAASNDTDRLASFSNFGATTVDLAAPGVGILSTLPGDRYGRYSGTSMATPHVAGVAALIKSQAPGLDDAQVKAKLLRSVDQRASLQGKVATDGRLNAARPLTENTEGPPTVANADTTKPRVSSPRPAPGGSTRDRTPNIAATVTDAETELRQDSIKLSVDGNRRNGFSYNGGTNRLTYTPPRLAYGRHKVKVVAEDDAGNVTTYTWGFKVVR